MKKRNKIKTIILSAIIAILILVGAIYVYKQNEFKEVTNPEQIKSVEISDNQLKITIDLPKYRSISGYMSSNSPQENSNSIEVLIFTQIDLSMKNKETISIDPSGLEEKDTSINDLEYVLFTGNGENVKTVKINNSNK